MLENKTTIIFDLDGTLIDSIGIWNEVDNLLISMLSNNTIHINNIGTYRDNYLKKVNSEDIYLEYCKHLKEITLSSKSEKEILQLRWDISDYLIKHKVKYKAKAATALKLLKEKGYTLVLATTTTRIQLDAYINDNENIKSKAPLNEIFSLMLSKEDVKNKKPHKEIYDKIMTNLNIKPEECLVIEDSLIGVEAAKNANMDVAVIYDKYSDNVREEINRLSDYQFSDYYELIREIKKADNKIYLMK